MTTNWISKLMESIITATGTENSAGETKNVTNGCYEILGI
jgi:hypothetical protein